MDTQLLIVHIKWAEGFRQYPYKDTAGKTSIGFGRNLDGVGIRVGEALFMLKNDIGDVLREARTMSYWSSLSPVRKIVIADMVFNMGLPKVLLFKRMAAALAKKDYNLASAEMKDSRWYNQTERRAEKLIKAMRTGIWEGE